MMRQPRERSEPHLQFIRGLPCCICGNNIETEAAHIRFSCLEAGKRSTGIGEKSNDKWTVPLCGNHHRMQHAWGEREFWKAAGRDPIKIAQELWAHSGNHEVGLRITNGGTPVYAGRER
jgi:hypothetical protein